MTAPRYSSDYSQKDEFSVSSYTTYTTGASPETAPTTTDNDDNDDHEVDARSVHSVATSYRRASDNASLSQPDSASRYPTANAYHYASDDVARREQRVIFHTKWVLLFAYIGSLVSLTATTYRYVKNQEENNFRNEFEIFAEDAIALTGQNVRNAFDAMELFSTTISSFVSNSNMTWPQVVIPNFSAQAQRFANIGGANLITFGVIVEEDERLEFEEWSRSTVHAQIQEDIDYLQLNATATELEGIPDVISALNITSGQRVPETRPGPYLVNWQRFPFETPPNRIFVKNNLLALRTNLNAFATTQITRRASLSFAQVIIGIRGQIFQPIFDQVESGRIVGVLWVTSFWARYFRNLLPDSAVGIVAVLESSCGFQATFLINGRDVEQLGLEDLHDPAYDDMEVSGELFTFSSDAEEDLPDNICLDKLSLRVFPSEDFEDSYLTSAPLLYAGLVLLIFIVAMVLFVIYDLAVNRRQLKVMLRLHKQDRIVADLFPELIMTRLYEGYDQDGGAGGMGGLDGSDDESYTDLSKTTPERARNKSFASPAATETPRSQALADLYPEATIMHADLIGFTAWSSQRAPSQVFTLLESLFVELDKMTHRYQVFKVESIGDCYIAVTGVPEADPHHAVHMARFARHCLAKSLVLLRKLEVKLGPDTGGLQLRMGLHSGQVTAGVLRGERARFQLFGDSVNTARLLLNDCKGNRIHLSESTADLLRKAEKHHWVHKRSEKITLLGKGTMQTYWMRTQSSNSSKHDGYNKILADTSAEMGQIEEGDDEGENEQRVGHGTASGDHEEFANPDDQKDHGDNSVDSSERMDEDIFQLLNEDGENAALAKQERLVGWHVEVLSELLEKVLVARAASPSSMDDSVHSVQSLAAIELSFSRNKTVLEEFQEIITLPKATAEDLLRRKQNTSKGICVPQQAKDQLRHFLTIVSEMYNHNAFHNFEHASHVTASVSKMLARITDTDKVANANPQTSVSSSMKSIQDLAGHSYGITSDPLTQFAVVFSAIIHDVDHPGVTNAQLVKERSYLAVRYNDKSVAEQNSVDLIWDLFISPEFTALRQCIYTNEDELRRFRQLIVNIVMATDITDKELGALRKNRWKLAFSEEASELVSPEDDVDRKATIVLEHLIQASDVSHTMQHWEIYLQWNEWFFNECYGAYRKGRAASDPSQGWYQGEIGFYDFYIIPLAKKLKSCGVFGVSSDEYLDYALANRKLWEENGQTIVDDFMKRFEALGDGGSTSNGDEQ